jgi:hypothetical protein
MAAEVIRRGADLTTPRKPAKANYYAILARRLHIALHNQKRGFA